MDPVIIRQVEECVHRNLASLRISLNVQGSRPSQQSSVFLAWREKVERYVAKIQRELEAGNTAWLVNEMEGATKSLLLEQLNNMVRHDTELGVADQYGKFELY